MQEQQCERLPSVPDHEHDHDEHAHSHEGHDHDGHDHDNHAVIVDRLPAGAWSIDPDGSDVFFKARALFGLLPVTGVFERISGGLMVDAQGGVNGQLVVETASVNSGVRRRDADLRSPAYFDSAQFPQMTFMIDALTPSGHDHLTATGSLQIQSTRIPLDFPVYAIAHGDHLHLEGSVKVDHDVAGLGWSKPLLVGKRVKAEAALTLTRGS